MPRAVKYMKRSTSHQGADALKLQILCLAPAVCPVARPELVFHRLVAVTSGMVCNRQVPENYVLAPCSFAEARATPFTLAKIAA